MEINEYVAKYAEDLKRRIKESVDFPMSSPPVCFDWGDDIECILYVALDQFQHNELEFLSEAADQVTREMVALATSIDERYPSYSFQDWAYWAYWSCADN
jgi:hypothetical protein